MHSQDNLRKLGDFSGPTQIQRTVIGLSACLFLCVCFVCVTSDECVNPREGHRWLGPSSRPAVACNGCQPQPSLLTGVHLYSVTHKHTEGMCEQYFDGRSYRKIDDGGR